MIIDTVLRYILLCMFSVEE